MTLTAQLTTAGAVAEAAWLLAFGLSVIATRNGTVEPGPATQELGTDPESPALVSLLANNWRSVDHAAESTLLDLAARKHIELRQSGDNPADTTVHVSSGSAGSADALNPYEKRVLARVAAQAGAAGAPIGAVTFRAEEPATAWNRELRQEVIVEARRRGLSRARFSGRVASALFTAAFVPAVLFGLAVLTTGRVGPAITIGSVAVAPLAALLTRALGERATPAGLARAGHWLGVQSWLRAHENFAQLPPASVAVWDRYLAYGAALGVTSRINQLLDFGTGNRRRVWSSYGGTWRCVRIRYPRLRPGYGASPGRLLQLAAAAATVAAGVYVFAELRRPGWAVTTGPDADHSLRRPGLILSVGWVLIALIAVAVAGRFNRWTLVLAFLAVMPGNFASIHGVMAHAMDTRGLLPGEAVAVWAFGGLAGLYLVLLVLGRSAARTFTGEVLRIESRRNAKAPRFLALDEGGLDRTVAWALPAGLPARVATGSTVRVTVERATRRVRSVEVLDAGSDFRPEPTSVKTAQKRQTFH